MACPWIAAPAVNDVLVQQGAYWTTQDRNVVLVESHFAEFHRLAPGDRLTFITPQGEQELRIIGIAASPEYLINAASKLDILPSARRFGVFFVPLPRLQALFGLDEQINDVAVTVRNSSEREATIAATEALLRSSVLTQTVRQEDQPSNAALQLDLQGADELANLLPTLVLIVAALSIFIALSRMVQAQREQIGLFMAMGYSRGTVLRHYLAYAALIALVGSLAGVALGLWLGAGLTGVYAETLGIPLVEHKLQLLPPIMASVVSMVIALIAGLVPAWRSARMQPAAAMRRDPQVALVKGSIPWIERALRLVLTPPLTLRIPLRAIFRTRVRSLYTVAGVSFAMVLLLTSAGIFDTMTNMLNTPVRAGRTVGHRCQPPPNDRLCRLADHRRVARSTGRSSRRWKASASWTTRWEERRRAGHGAPNRHAAAPLSTPGRPARQLGEWPRDPVALREPGA